MSEMVTISNEELKNLRYQEALFRYLAERAPVPVVLTHLGNSELLFTNETTWHVFNKGEKPTGFATHWYHNPNDRAAMLQKLKADGKLHNYPLKMRRSDDSIGDFLMSMTPIVVEGQPVLYAFALDVTDQKIAERALHARNEEMSLILDNVAEGLLTIDATGHICGERSSVVERWFGKPAHKIAHKAQGQHYETFWEYVARADETFAMWFQLGWESVTDAVLPLQVSLEQLPHLLRAGDKHIKVICTPIGGYDADAVPERFLVILSDITEAVEREKAESVQREILGVFDRIIRDRSGVAAFLQENTDVVRYIGQEQDPITLKRYVHTLKGNCSIFGLQSIAELCHLVENKMIENGTVASPQERNDIASAWQDIAARIKTFLEARSEDSVELDGNDVHALTAALQEQKPYEEILAMVQGWKDEPVRRRLVRIGQQANALAERLGKGSLNIEIDDNQLRLPNGIWSEFWTSFSHAVRNAIDHGIESPDERVQAGKPEQGTLFLATYKTVYDGKKYVAVDIRDDGRGIHWEAVAAKAQKLGLPTENQTDLENALFSDGLSTRDAATDISGRGVGTSALKASVVATGGFVEVRSVAGQGAGFIFYLPYDEVENYQKPEKRYLAAQNNDVDPAEQEKAAA